MFSIVLFSVLFFSVSIVHPKGDSFYIIPLLAGRPLPVNKDDRRYIFDGEEPLLPKKTAYTPEERDQLHRIGKHLRSLRLKQGLTQEQMAERAGLNRNYLGDTERGERNIAVLNLLQLARGCGLSLRELFPDDL